MKSGRYVALNDRATRLLIADLGYAANTHAMAIDGDTLKTTQGAEVPVEHVRRILPIVLRLIDRGETYETPPDAPIRVGSFQLRSVDSAGLVTVGCHRFDGREVRRINGVLNPV